MKRRYPSVPGHQLAIEEGGESSRKQPRLSEGGPVIQEMEEQDISNMTGLARTSLTSQRQSATSDMSNDFSPLGSLPTGYNHVQIMKCK